MNNSKKFIKYLDNYDKNKQYTFTDYQLLTKNINENFYLSTSQNPYINNNMKINFNNMPSIDTKIVVNKVKQNIDISFNSLEDLIKVTELYSYNENKEYNIDLKSLHNIKDDLNILNSMIGLTELKQSIFEQIIYFMLQLHVDNNTDYKHTILFGPPGTGKTVIAEIIGKIYSKIGVLKKNIFKKVTRDDLIAGYLGQTAIKTKRVINESLGGVLFIDEAYSLSNGENGDSYSKECLDVLCESLSNYKNDLMVIIAGYESELDNTIFRVNQGLSSRFIWRFNMNKYNFKELMQIFKRMVYKQGWTLNEEVGESWFSLYYDNFSNYGRDMETLLTCVKISHSLRIYGKNNICKKDILLIDMNNGIKKYKMNRKNKVKNISSMYI
jgi:SpoVK/Ycf46/Vps4 family AAA+-type ATPase